MSHCSLLVNKSRHQGWLPSSIKSTRHISTKHQHYDPAILVKTLCGGHEVLQLQEPHETMDDIKRPVLPIFFPTFSVHLWDAGCMLVETVLASDNIVMELKVFRPSQAAQRAVHSKQYRVGQRGKITVVSCAMRSVSFNASAKYASQARFSSVLQLEPCASFITCRSILLCRKSKRSERKCKTSALTTCSLLSSFFFSRAPLRTWSFFDLVSRLRRVRKARSEQRRLKWIWRAGLRSPNSVHFKGGTWSAGGAANAQIENYCV